MTRRRIPSRQPIAPRPSRPTSSRALPSQPPLRHTRSLARSWLQPTPSRASQPGRSTVAPNPAASGVVEVFASNCSRPTSGPSRSACRSSRTAWTFASKPGAMTPRACCSRIRTRWQSCSRAPDIASTGWPSFPRRPTGLQRPGRRIAGVRAHLDPQQSGAGSQPDARSSGERPNPEPDPRSSRGNQDDDNDKSRIARGAGGDLYV